MNKKGFTLIELLAVIVVLAIIALIATPIVMRLISDAQEGANARSVEGYMKAYEAAYYDYMLKNGGKAPGSDFRIATSDYSGAEVNCDNIAVVNGKFTATCSVVGYDGRYKYENGTATKVGSISSEFDPNTVTIPEGKICVLVEGPAKEIGSKYVCNPGDKNRVFYVLDNSDNISLMMDRNIDNDTMNWCLDGYGSDICDGNGAKSALASKTSGWINRSILSIALPTVEQIFNAREIIGADDLYFKYITFLNNNLDFDDNTDIPEGYWTSTQSQGSCGNDCAYFVTVKTVDAGANAMTPAAGVRPVITISKDSI